MRDGCVAHKGLLNWLPQSCLIRLIGRFALHFEIFWNILSNFTLVPNNIINTTNRRTYVREIPKAVPPNEQRSFSSKQLCIKYLQSPSGLTRRQCTFLCAIAKLRKATIGFVMSVRLSASPSIRMEQLGSHSTHFHEIWYWSVFLQHL